MVGCRVGAKNTLRKNYLALAENLGVTIEPMRTVTRLGVVPGTQGEQAAYRVLHERTGPVTGRDPQVVTARRVVLAAGAWGTQTLLHDMKAKGELPRLSDHLGHRTRTNSEALLGAMTQHVPSGDLDLTKGVAITSSFHVDETPMSRTAATARAPTPWACSPRWRCPAARGARAGSSCCARSAGIR